MIENSKCTKCQYHKKGYNNTTIYCSKKGKYLVDIFKHCNNFKKDLTK